MEAVDPNDLAANFGPGLRLKGATIEMTADPVTTGIEKWLPWIASLPENYHVMNGTPFSSAGPLGTVQYLYLRRGVR